MIRITNKFNNNSKSSNNNNKLNSEALALLYKNILKNRSFSNKENLTLEFGCSYPLISNAMCSKNAMSEQVVKIMI